MSTRDEYVCAACKKKIKSGNVSKALGKRWHQDCFRCAKCDAPVMSSFLTLGDKIYDKECFNEEHGINCEICGEYICGHILKYNDKGYHYSCISCDYCHSTFIDGAQLSVKDGVFIHNDCKQAEKGATKGEYDAVTALREEIENEEEFDESYLEDFEGVCLKEHNKLREEHNVEALGWSVQCAEHAQMWVQKLVEQDGLLHDTSSGMGENCGYFNSSSAASKPNSEWAEKVAEMWYNEINKYDYSKNEYQQQTGHFTQMVWKSTTKMGCAIAKNGNRVYIVANYYPPGNFVGRYKHNVNRKAA